MPSPKAYIVVLNYKGWSDTVECLESLHRLTYPNYQIVVVDNFSNDNSLEYIEDWAAGGKSIEREEENTLNYLSNPPIRKPLRYLSYLREEAEKGGGGSLDEDALILIQTGANLGFAGGNNVALKYIIQREDADYVWLLNNDTVAEPNSLTHLIARYNDSSLEQVGLVGGKVKYYYSPDVIQSVGSHYNKWLGYSKQIGNNEIDKGQFDSYNLQPDLINGACMIVSISFLKIVGLLNEEYFLYFEEQDWAERARRCGFSLRYAHKAIIYHKEGKTIGAGQWLGSSKFSDFYFSRSKLLFTRRYHNKLILTTVKMSFLLTILNRLRRGQFDRIPMLLDIMTNYESGKLRE